MLTLFARPTFGFCWVDDYLPNESLFVRQIVIFGSVEFSTSFPISLWFFVNVFCDIILSNIYIFTILGIFNALNLLHFLQQKIFTDITMNKENEEIKKTC